MKFYKLNLGSYQQIAIRDLPKNIVLPFNPSRAVFDCLLAFVQFEVPFIRNLTLGGAKCFHAF